MILTGYQLLHQGTAVDTSNRLNHLFHGRAGVRASAAFTLGLMTISILLMKPRLPPKRCDGSLLINFQAFIREPTYVLTSFRSILSRPYVCSDVKVNELFLRVDRNIFSWFLLAALCDRYQSTLAFYSVLANFKDVHIRTGIANDPPWWAE